MIKEICSAFRFLTILPMPIKTEYKHLEKSICWFPLVGAMIGVITGFGYVFLSRIFSVGVSSALVIIIYIVLTRALHLDGFADTIDGFFSRKDRETVLRIMKESTVGSFAVMGLGIWLLLFYSCIPFLRVADHIAIFTFSRMAILPLPLLFDYPRESGTGKFFVDNVKGKTIASGILITLFIMAVLIIASLGSWSAVSFLNMLPTILFYGGSMLVAILLSIVLGHWYKKIIGGVTGDTLGFTIEAVQLLFVVILPALERFYGVYKP